MTRSEISEDITGIDQPRLEEIINPIIDAFVKDTKVPKAKVQELINLLKIPSIPPPITPTTTTVSTMVAPPATSTVSTMVAPVSSTPADLDESDKLQGLIYGFSLDFWEKIFNARALAFQFLFMLFPPKTEASATDGTYVDFTRPLGKSINRRFTLDQYGFLTALKQTSNFLIAGVYFLFLIAYIILFLLFFAVGRSDNYAPGGIESNGLCSLLVVVTALEKEDTYRDELIENQKQGKKDVLYDYLEGNHPDKIRKFITSNDCLFFYLFFA